MFLITPEQKYILNILEKTRFMRTNQAFRFLNSIDSEKNESYTIRQLKQLKHMQKIIWKTDSLFALPSLYNEPVDKDMLSAIDIMINLTDCKILALSTDTPPYKLCFFAEQQNNLGSYAVIPVHRATEAAVTATLYGTASENRTLIFLLSEFAQKNCIKTTLPHFYAVYDNGRYRYFEGGG